MHPERSALISTLVSVCIGLGIAVAGSSHGQSVRGLPVFALCVAIAFLIQWLVFLPAYLLQTERFFDLTGSLTYIGVVTIAVLLTRPVDIRSMLLWALVVIWALRLGAFLFGRIRRAGKDDRFDELKPSFVRFMNVWTIQALWVSLTLGAALAAITSGGGTRVGETSAATPGLDAFAVAGLIVWIVGFAIEATADAQKRRFRADPSHKDRFISTGLWSWSRHPNYFGEIMLWTGIAIIALPALIGWQWVTLVSPVFVFVLLTRVSGIPLLEKKADDAWGGQDAYRRYKARTALLFPRPPRRS
jgi:steroid 5-alpha reductase family enzyme